MLNYPLNLSFKVLTLGPEIRITDANGDLIVYVKQKAFKLKEEVTVFADAERTQPLYSINADRILDFSARYSFTDQQGISLGAVKRQGMKSLWKARYDILDGEEATMTIQEENPWIKVADGCLSQIPIVNLFAGYVLNPTYVVLRADETPVLRLVKQPAFFEGKYTIEQLVPLEEYEEQRVLLSLIMMVLLERWRG